MIDLPVGDAGDVLVVGGGATGLLAARALVRAGASVTVVEQDDLAGAQSGHSHGYLHQGYIYLRPTDAIVGSLRPAAREWESLVRASGVPFETERSLVAFRDGDVAAAAARSWSTLQLDEHRWLSGRALAELSGGVLTRPAAACVPERTVDVSRVVHRMLARDLAAVGFVRGRVEALRLRGERIGGVEVRRVDGRREVLVAKAYVLAAGCGLVALLAAARGHAGALMTRQSYMLVLRHERLPCTALVLPGERDHGLFVAPRRPDADGRVTWLVSNYASYTGSGTDAGARLWLRQVARTLAGATSVFDFDGLAWGYYPAPKAEFRGPDTGRLDRPVCSHLDSPRFDASVWPNAGIAVPVKLTLAPVVVERIVRWALPRLDRRAPGSDGPCRLDAPVVADELWRSALMHPAAVLRQVKDARHLVEIPHWREHRSQQSHVLSAHSGRDMRE